MAISSDELWPPRRLFFGCVTGLVSADVILDQCDMTSWKAAVSEEHLFDPRRQEHAIHAIS